jgi:hypothetical protein
MIRRWWKRYLYGVGAANHLERCPFCGPTCDIRNPGQVVVHYNHQLAAGAPPAGNVMPDEERLPHLRNVVPSGNADQIRTSVVSGRPRILVVEDGWVLAEALCLSLLEAGFEPVGPAPSVEKARYSRRSGAGQAKVEAPPSPLIKAEASKLIDELKARLGR